LIWPQTVGSIQKDTRNVDDVPGFHCSQKKEKQEEPNKDMKGETTEN